MVWTDISEQTFAHMKRILFPTKKPEKIISGKPARKRAVSATASCRTCAFVSGQYCMYGEHGFNTRREERSTAGLCGPSGAHHLRHDAPGAVEAADEARHYFHLGQRPPWAYNERQPRPAWMRDL